MKILFITTGHNGLSQRAWTELVDRGHDIYIQLATSDTAMEEAVRNFKPDLILAPFLKKAIPDAIWKNHVCLIVHPGIKGDRGPSSLDWAIMKEETEWGVTILQAAEEMDAGDIWSSNNFSMRPVSKSNLYRHEVTGVAMEGILDAVEKFESGTFQPEKLDYGNPGVKGTWNNPIKRKDRTVDWTMTSAEIIKRIKAADSNPGLLEETIFPFPCFMYGAHQEDVLIGKPGQILAKRHGAICIATGNGAVWVSHLKNKNPGHFKLPAVQVLNGYIDNVIVSDGELMNDNLSVQTFREIWYEEKENVGYLHFNFYNGAISTEQCQRLRKAYFEARRRATDIIVLMGGHDIWSNGIHLNVIEHADNPAHESWNNIVAIDDFIRDVITTNTHYIISALHGNAGAGGVIMALAADRVLARKGIILNPHYKKMRLFGSEYWTYLLPKRVGHKMAEKLTSECLPIYSEKAKEIGLIDESSGHNIGEFSAFLNQKIEEIKSKTDFNVFKSKKKKQLLEEMAQKSLDDYRNRELDEMWKNFYDVNSQYHTLRHFFVHKIDDVQQPTSHHIDEMF